MKELENRPLLLTRKQGYRLWWWLKRSKHTKIIAFVLARQDHEDYIAFEIARLH